MHVKPRFACALAVILALACTSQVVHTQSTQSGRRARVLITQNIDEAKLAMLKGKALLRDAEQGGFLFGVQTNVLCSSLEANQQTRSLGIVLEIGAQGRQEAQVIQRSRSQRSGKTVHPFNCPN